jgi:hypothetical protein
VEGEIPLTAFRFGDIYYIDSLPAAMYNNWVIGGGNTAIRDGS